MVKSIIVFERAFSGAMESEIVVLPDSASTMEIATVLSAGASELNIFDIHTSFYQRASESDDWSLIHSSTELRSLLSSMTSVHSSFAFQVNVHAGRQFKVELQVGQSELDVCVVALWQ